MCVCCIPFIWLCLGSKGDYDDQGSLIIFGDVTGLLEVAAKKLTQPTCHVRSFGFIHKNYS